MDADRYVNEGIGFEVQKPSDWVFIATPWAVHLRRQNVRSHEELRDIMAQASAPFVYAHLPHGQPDSVFPTLQASCRVAAPSLEPKAVLPLLVSQFERQFRDFELLQSTADAIVGGRPATLIKGRFTLQSNEGVEFRCVSRSYAVFALPLVFMVGLSCAADGPYHVEDELDAITRSIRVRAPSA